MKKIFKAALGAFGALPFIMVLGFPLGSIVDFVARLASGVDLGRSLESLLWLLASLLLLHSALLCRLWRFDALELILVFFFTLILSSAITSFFNSSLVLRVNAHLVPACVTGYMAGGFWTMFADRKIDLDRDENASGKGG